MKTFLVAFILSLVTSLLATKLMVHLGWRLKVLDFGFGRKVHRGSIPRLGGPAVAIAFFAPVVGLMFWDNRLSTLVWTRKNQVIALILGGLLALALGLWDDVRRLRPRYKLAGQVVIATLAWLLGVRILLVRLPFLGEIDLSTVSLPLTVFWVVGLMNAVNLVDGVDGLCAGIVAIAGTATFIISVATDSHLVALFSASISGSVLGFLRYNFNPASIFLGDSGTYFLGYIMAVVSVVGASKATTAVTLTAPVLALGLPIMDTAFAVFRRAWLGRPVMEADRGHIHHRLLERGRTQRGVALFLYAVTFFFATAGVVVVLGRDWAAGLALITVMLVVFYIIRSLRLWQIRPSRGEVEGSGHFEERLRRALPAFFREIVSQPGYEHWPSAIRSFCMVAGIAQVEFVSGGDKTGGGGNIVPLLTISCGSDNNEALPIPVTRASFPLDNGIAVLVAWNSEAEFVKPEEKVLLQLFADFLRAEMRHRGEMPFFTLVSH